MAAKKQNSKKPVGLESYSFVRCEMNAEDKRHAKEWIEKNNPNVGALVHDLVASEYKLSVTFSSDHDTFTASATGKEGALNEYKTLTARHKDWSLAVMTLLYKHLQMFGGTVWESVSDEDDGWA